MIKNLIQSQELIEVINKSDLIKEYCGIPKDWKDIVKITPDSVHAKYGEGFKARFFSQGILKNGINPKLLIALDQGGVFKHLERKYGIHILEQFYLEENPLITNKIKYSSASFNPDANPETNTVDGYVYRAAVNETFSTIRGGTGTGSSDDGSYIDMRITATTTNNQYSTLCRGICLFNTSSLTTSNYVYSGTITVTPVLDGLDVNDFNASLTWTTASTASNTALASGDYAVAGFGSTHLTDDRAQSSMVTDVDEVFTLNESGKSAISLSSVTKLSIRFLFDVDNSSPTWTSGGENRIAFYDAENGPSIPQLDVTYFKKPTYQNLLLMGVG